jgi:hypothetical protein
MYGAAKPEWHRLIKLFEHCSTETSMESLKLSFYEPQAKLIYKLCTIDSGSEFYSKKPIYAPHARLSELMRVLNKDNYGSKYVDDWETRSTRFQKGTGKSWIDVAYLFWLLEAFRMAQAGTIFKSTTMPVKPKGIDSFFPAPLSTNSSSTAVASTSKITIENGPTFFLPTNMPSFNTNAAPTPAYLYPPAPTASYSSAYKPGASSFRKRRIEESEDEEE